MTDGQAMAVMHDVSGPDARRDATRTWLFEAALPLWWEAGADHRHGGFHDRLDRDRRPLAVPKRVRVQARQLFVYAEAGRIGWPGPWRTAVAHGLEYLLTRYRRDDGLYRASVNDAGAPVVDAADLYDQAFVLFGLAAAYVATGRPPAVLDAATRLFERLAAMLAHPIAGYEESVPRTLPLRSNPHMHLLEALLAWIDTGDGAAFVPAARAIVALALERLIDPATGAIGEYYDGDWRFAAGPAGQLREPGHQYEWAYLLDLAGRVLGGDHGAACNRLVAFGERHGVRDGRVLFAVRADGAVLDGSSRLWAQTERLRTMTLRARAGDAAAVQPAHDSQAVLDRFLDCGVPGLWRERMDVDGCWIDEAVPASSLYHIVTGLMPSIDG